MKSFKLLLQLLPIIFLINTSLLSQTGVLIDFGSSESGNIFGIEGWNELLLSPEMSYTDVGPGGVTLQTNLDEFTDFMGVSGATRNFAPGDRVVATWYNNSDEVFRFTSRISFTDQNNPSENSPDGNWYTMRSFNDYRETYVEIQPHSSAKTAFNITDHGVHKTDGNYSTININLTIEWYDSFMKQFLICDKVELLNDADISAPEIPTGLIANVLSHSKIHLEWSLSNDNVETVEYLVYRDGEVKGYTRTNSYTAVFLNPETNYDFTVTSVDAVGNESAHSAQVSAFTNSFSGRWDLVNPNSFEYVGSILLPEDFAYGADGFTYYPNGDGGEGNTDDDYPGSFFVTNINQPQAGFVGEVNIPSPTIPTTHSLEAVNTAEVITEPVNIRPESVNNWEYVDVWLTGLEYIEEENRLYSSWAIYYDVIFDKTASISCVDADDLAGGQKYGAWFLGSSDPANVPNDPYLNDYLFRVPSDWAEENIFGQELICGRYREGGLSGLGPTFYSFSQIGTTDPPAAGSEFDIATLLQYGPVEESDNYNFPNSIDDYNHADWWKGADWISIENQSAIALIGTKALGHNYYGYNGERMRHDWVIADLPYPEFAETDPDGKGWKSYNVAPMVVLFDPADLASVANGSKEPYEPQPYAAFRFQDEIFWSEEKQVNSACYDEYNKILYITEFLPMMDGRIIIHAFNVNYIPTDIAGNVQIPTDFKLYQNYPNPFNPSTTIKFSIPNVGRSGTSPYNIKLIVYDILGREIATLIDELMSSGNYEIEFSVGASLPSGVYFYRLSAGGFNKTNKMILVK